MDPGAPRYICADPKLAVYYFRVRPGSCWVGLRGRPLRGDATILCSRERRSEFDMLSRNESSVETSSDQLLSSEEVHSDHKDVSAPIAPHGPAASRMDRDISVK
jgi:hypothetical protein